MEFERFESRPLRKFLQRNPSYAGVFVWNGWDELARTRRGEQKQGRLWPPGVPMQGLKPPPHGIAGTKWRQSRRLRKIEPMSRFWRGFLVFELFNH